MRQRNAKLKKKNDVEESNTKKKKNEVEECKTKLRKMRQRNAKLKKKIMWRNPKLNNEK